MTLNYEVIQSLGVLKNGISLNSYQLKLLGVQPPPKSGWVRELIGKEISDDLFRVLLQLRGCKQKQVRKAILRENGISTSKLFHQSPSDRYLRLES